LVGLVLSFNFTPLYSYIAVKSLFYFHMDNYRFRSATWN